MGSVFGGGDKGPTKEQLEATRLAEEREKQSRVSLAKEQDKQERQRQIEMRRGRGLLAQTAMGGAGGFTLFGDENKKTTLG